MKVQYLLLLGIIGLSGCNNDNDQDPSALFSGDWSIPREDVLSGGPGVDGIPALENPAFIDVWEATYLSDNDLVVGFKSENDVRAYPHIILDWHEIINDDLEGDKSIAINYCPLTGTALGWNRVVDGTKTTFGVSGLLYNSNLIPYDRNTQSAWSQMLVESVNGDLRGEKADTYQVVETTWGTWKTMYPNTQVVSTNTGISRSYGRFPYLINGQDYRVQPFLIFPVDRDDDRLHRKERVTGIIVDGEARTYRISQMQDPITIIQEDFNGVPIVMVGSATNNFAMIFESQLNDGTQLTFTPVLDSLPIVMEDNEGNQWDVFGEALSGPRTGQKLIQTQSFIGYWFAWGAFYPGAEIGN